MFRRKRPVPPDDKEIAAHLSKLNALVTSLKSAEEAYLKEEEIKLELQWFDIHGLKLLRQEDGTHVPKPAEGSAEPPE